MREVLGKKLSKGTKKDLDDISTKTGITLKSCRRQVGTVPPQHNFPPTVPPSLHPFGHCPSSSLLPNLRLWQLLHSQSPLPSFCPFQTILYSSARVTFQKPRSDHSFPQLMNFHWFLLPLG